MRCFKALHGDSAIELVRLRAVIDSLLAEPRRLAEATARLHPGQAVQFVDLRSGQMRRGTLIARHGQSTTVLEDQMRRTWKIPLVAVAPAPAQRDDAASHYEPPPEPASPQQRIGVRVGDKVTFDDGKGKAVVGIVTRINRRTAILAAIDGRQWRVDFALLRHVVDVWTTPRQEGREATLTHRRRRRCLLSAQR